MPKGDSLCTVAEPRYRMAYSPSRGLLYTDPEEPEERRTSTAEQESTETPAPADD